MTLSASIESPPRAPPVLVKSNHFLRSAKLIQACLPEWAEYFGAGRRLPHGHPLPADRPPAHVQTPPIKKGKAFAKIALVARNPSDDGISETGCIGQNLLPIEQDATAIN
jgi:hypothetical protein